jgi:ABC-type Fe3+ transport system substrate-binding protein
MKMESIAMRPKKRKAWFGWLSSMVLLLGLSSGALGQSAGPADWQAIQEAARKEGKITVGIPASGDLRRVLEKSFTERFKGIQIELVSGPAPMIANRIVSESKGGIRNFDVFLSGSGSALALAGEGLLEPFESYMVLPEVKDPKNWFGGYIWVDNVTTKRFIYAFQAYVTDPAYYNTELMKGGEIRSYDDLLNPKWKGRLGIHEPRSQGAGQAVWIYMWTVKGENYLKKLAEQDLIIAADYRQLGEMLAKGRLALAMGATYSTLSPFIKAGLPVAPLPVPKEGIHATIGFGAASVIKNHPHPNATRVFLNWFLGKEGQDLYGRAVGNATRRLDVDTKWAREIGVQAAKDHLTVEEYLKRESFFEGNRATREPAEELAKKLLK